MYGNAEPSRYEIVGVVGNVHSRGLDVPAAPALLPVRPSVPPGTDDGVVRTDGKSGAAAPGAALSGNPAAPIRNAVRSVDANLPVVNMQPLEAHLSAALARPRFLSTVLAAFATAALLLSVLGVHGLLAYVVQQRRGELAVRQALGATRSNIVRLVLGGGVLLAIGGALTGLATAVALGRSLSSVLYQVEPGDPVALTVAPATILASGAIAALIPAWRAARADATAALRGE
jgi:predicted lysophospholipase L1 biosynthesis ABC-type transport system permease subunit